MRLPCEECGGSGVLQDLDRDEAAACRWCGGTGSAPPPELASGMRFEGDLMGYWAYNDAREPKHTTPEERAELERISRAVQALRRLGWSDAVYCPKDGTEFLAIEAGCTAVYPCCYRGEWPDGHWWIHHAGDEWPARPILFLPMRAPVEAPEVNATETA